MKFKSWVAEEGFLKQKRAALVHNMGLYCLIIGGLGVAQGSIIVGSFASGGATVDSEVQDMRLKQAFLMFLLIIITVVPWLTMKLLNRLQRMVFLLEPMAMTTIIMTLGCGVLTDKYYLTRLLGSDLDIWGPKEVFTDARVLLAIDACVTVTHMLIPLRWVVLLALEIFGLFLYLFLAVGLGSAEQGMVHFNAVLLGFLVWASAMGKRMSERSERAAYASVARERMLRAEAQFKLSQQESAFSAQEGPAARDEDDGRLSTAPSTTPTDRVFELDPNADFSVQLEQIQAVGKREHWFLDCERLLLDPKRLLGAGAFGMVVGGLYNSMPVAVKIPVDFQESGGSARHLVSLANELRILRHLRHPNVVFFFGATIINTPEEEELDRRQLVRPSSQARLALVLEYVHGVSLDGVMRTSQAETSMQDRFMLILGIVRALRYLHALRPQVIHGDLKPSNVLVEMLRDGPRAKLVDFGLSRVLTRRSKPAGGTAMWMAPEILRRCPPSSASDMFSFGRLTFFIIVGEHPFAGIPRKAWTQIIKGGCAPPMPWPEAGSLVLTCKDVADRCVDTQPARRPNATEVVDVVESWRQDLNNSDLSGASFGSAMDIRSADAYDFHSAVKEATAIFKQNKSVSPLHSVQQEKVAVAVSQTLQAMKLQAGSSSRSTQPLQPIAEETSSRTRAEEPPVRCAVPNLLPTDAGTRQLAVLTTIMRWNVEVPPSSCCAFHATMAALLSVCNLLHDRACPEEFLPSGVTYSQCPSCRLIDEAPVGACDFCGAAAAGTGSTCSGPAAADEAPQPSGELLAPQAAADAGAPVTKLRM